MPEIWNQFGACNLQWFYSVDFGFSQLLIGGLVWFFCVILDIEKFTSGIWHQLYMSKWQAPVCCSWCLISTRQGKSKLTLRRILCIGFLWRMKNYKSYQICRKMWLHWFKNSLPSPLLALELLIKSGKPIHIQIRYILPWVLQHQLASPSEA